VPQNPTVAVIGLGYVGSCLAATLADRGLDIVAIDSDPTLIDDLDRGHFRIQEPGLAHGLSRAIATGRLRVTTDYQAATAASVILITVGTPIYEDGTLADEQLSGACRALGRHLRPGQLVVLKSTVPPGTTRNLVLPLLESGGLTAGADFHLAFAPERLAEGAALAELRMFPIVVGGLDEASTGAAARFWSRALDVEVIRQDSLEAAEIIKLAGNWWIDVNIALANELARYCALHDVDVLDVIRATNSLPKGTGNVNVLLPSVGVGGSCLTKDPWMVWRSARDHGLEIRTVPTSREVNAGMPRHTAQLIIDHLLARGRAPTEATVAVLGLAFKNNTGDLRATPVRVAVEELTKAGVTVRCHDPLADPGRAEDLLGIRPVATPDEAAWGADCLAVLAHHRQFENIDYARLPVAHPCLILDGRAYFPKEKIAELRALGYDYRGIGR
jgi:dTDP-alpha-D-glucose dehydrogenase